MAAIFKRTEINGMELKNRLVRSATHEAMADDNGFPTDRLFKLYDRLAKGGVGLIITGYAYVSPDGKSTAMLGIDTDDHIHRYRELVDQAHQNGAKIAMQINHHTNRREDKWGGSIENRMRFVTGIYERARKYVGEDYPVLIKISAYDHMKNGMKLEESAVMAGKLAEMGIDGIEVSCGINEDGLSMLRGDTPFDVILDEWEMYKNKNFLYRFMVRKFGSKLVKPLPFKQGYNRESAGVIKKRVDVPVFAVGGMVDPAFMEETIENGDADYISLCRALITDPSFPNKIKEGSRELSRCIHCNLCLYYLTTRSVRCYRGKRMKSN